MSTYTKNLNLFKYDTSKDSNVAFSITKALNNNWDIIDAKCGQGNNILDFKWSDHILNDQSWLRADTFSWQSGTTYSLAYNELLSEYNNSASTAKTEGSITFKRTPKGYKIALANQETAILNKYNSDGIAWYYILDTTNKRFKLPRTKFGFEGLRTSVGDDIEAGLPTHTHTFTRPRGDQNYNSGYGNSWWGATNNITVTTSTPNNSIYGKSDTVQPPATQMYLYFYVGNFTKSAEAQTAGLKSELLNSKVDSSSLVDCQVVIDTYVNGTSGYRIWSDGYCEQWGKIPFTATGGWASGTITFLKPFKDTNYYINGRGNWGDRQSCDFGLNSKTTTNVNVTVAINTLTSENGAWKACGYLAEGEY